MKIVLSFAIVFFGFFICKGQTIHYDVSFDNIVHHELNISITITGTKDQSLLFRMSRSSPGRYATHEFGKNIYNVQASGPSGSITITRIDGDVYEIVGAHESVKVNYTLYGNYADGTYAGIDQDGVHLNIPASFMWVKGFDQKPVSITFNLPKDKHWKIATQLQPTSDAETFTAPGLQYFMDCPTKIGRLITKEWTLKNPDNKTYQFILALDAETSEKAAGDFAEKIKRITQEAQAVYGEFPAYDFGTYTFLTSINPYVRGDGMEHRNSTMISMGTQFNPNQVNDVFAHEFFHCWNVERIRPKTLEPFNFEKSNMSDGLWFAEGFTNYYGQLLTERAGFSSIDELIKSFSNVINTKEIRPGSHKYSPVQMSQNAVFVDAGVAVDKSNYDNTYSSYYTYGEAIALALDLELRHRFNLSLDNYMAAAWKKFGKTETPYTVDGLMQLLGEVTNNGNFAKEFFDKYVTGHASFNYAPLLAKAGFVLKKEAPGEAWIGSVSYKKDNVLTIATNTIIGSPLYDAGLDVEDQILSIGGQNLTTEKELNDLLKNRRPGEKVPIIYIHRGKQKIAEMTLAESPKLTISSFEKEGMKINDDILAFRQSWLASKVK